MKHKREIIVCNTDGGKDAAMFLVFMEPNKFVSNVTGDD